MSINKHYDSSGTGSIGSTSSCFRSSQLPPRKPVTLNVSRGISHMTKTSSGAQWAGERPKNDILLCRSQDTNIIAQLQASVQAAKQQASRSSMAAAAAAAQANGGGATSSSGGGHNSQSPPSEFDIALLREKSKHLDLPLISALCNDRSLLKQTKVLAQPKTAKQQQQQHQNNSGGSSSSSSTGSTPPNSNSMEINGTNANTNSSNGSSPTSSATSAVGKTISSSNNSTSNTTNTMGGKSRKTSISHRHPNDKLPPLPMQLAEANNYVMDPAVLKHHKSYNSPHT